MRSASAASLAALSLAASASSAPAQGLLDANCPGPPNHQTMVSSDERNVQTFTARSTGILVRAEIEVLKPGAGTPWEMHIVATDGSGAPTNTELAAGTGIDDASVPVGPSRIVGLFGSPASVRAGQQYGLLISRGSSFDLRDRNGNPCPGQEFFSFAGGPFTPEDPNYDWVFATYVKPTNAFTLGPITRNKKKGTATLTVNVPNPGELTGSGKGAKVAGAAGAVISKSVGTGPAQLLIKSKGKKKRKLNETGKVKVIPKITYTPAGGDPATQSRKLTLKKKL